MGIMLSIRMRLCYTIRDFRPESLYHGIYPFVTGKSERFGIVHKIDNSCTDFSAVVFMLQKSEIWRNENEE